MAEVRRCVCVDGTSCDHRLCKSPDPVRKHPADLTGPATSRCHRGGDDFDQPDSDGRSAFRWPSKRQLVISG